MADYGKNIYFHHRLPANLKYIKGMFDTLFLFRRMYKNYFEVFKKVVRSENKIDLELRNGEVLTNFNFTSVYVITELLNCSDFELDIKNDLVTVKSLSWFENNNTDVKIYGGITNGDVVHVFFKHEYSMLPVKDKIVIDIGANIGDSSISFAMRGAKKVIALEPFKKNHSFAEKNVEINNLSNKITVVLAGCSAKKGHIVLDPNFKSNVASVLQDSGSGVKVPLMSLNQIIEQYEIPKGSILKLDCEGCEYDSILSASNETLEKFDRILIEYHHGYKDLLRRLEKCNFTVNLINPTSTGFIGKYFRWFKSKNWSNGESRPGYSGYVYAIKND